MKVYLIEYENGVQQTKNYFTELEYQEKIVPVKNEILELHKEKKYVEADKLTKVLKKFTGEYFTEKSPMGIALNSNSEYMLLPDYKNFKKVVKFISVENKVYLDMQILHNKKYYLKFKKL